MRIIIIIIIISSGRVGEGENFELVWGDSGGCNY
jgi:hypothetical protein